MRVLSYNIRSLRDDTTALAEVVRACAPDVLCLQEVPRFLFGGSKLRRLASACGLSVAAAGRPAAELAVLVRPGVPVTAARSVTLPWHPPRHRRGLAYAVAGGIAVGSIHLSLDPAERLDQAGRVLRLIRESGTPVVLAGDVNEEPDGAAWRLLAAALSDPCDGPTHPAHAPRRRIDGIFVDPRLDVASCGVPDVPRLAGASDHCPVLAVVG